MARGLTLETERLVLRAFRPADEPLYALINADPQTMTYLGGVLTRSQSDAQILGANRSLTERGYGKVAIERKADGAFLGMCGLSRERWYPDDLEIGWRLAPQARGFGYATEAARAWITYGFDVLGLDRITSIADVPNTSSIAVMERLGMSHDHTAWLEDDRERFKAVIYAISADQVIAAKRSSKA